MNGGHTLVALVLSGGGGTRLWPLSTEARPKQFLKLFGKRSLFQRTLARLNSAGVERIAVVTNLEQEAEVDAQTRELGIHPPLLILEPSRRDSAAAIAAGIAALEAIGAGDATVLAAPCDHLIPDAAHFARSLSQAVALADAGYLATFGIRPTFASTEFGYIQQGEAIAGIDGAHSVVRFHEKPDHARAQDYLASGAYHWNSGMFVFRAGTFRAEAAQLMPDVWRAAHEAVRRARSSAERVVLDAEAFGAAPRISIDFALMEKSRRVGVVPATFDWSDVGNWSAVHAALPHDTAGNACLGEAAAHDGAGNLVIAEGTRVVAIGVDNLVIVSGPGGTFVAPRDRAAEIKALLERPRG